IALNLEEIPYDIKPVNLVKSSGEQHSNEFREINPMEKVPALHIDNHTLIESVTVEKLLSSSAGKYCVGDEITLADCCLVPQIYNARKFHVDLTPFSTILRIGRHLEHHPAFPATHPNNQPDCPPEAIK
ncbi:MAAI2 isomerase, partial [Pseudoatta argentina]